MVPQRLTCTILCMFQIHGGVTKMWQSKLGMAISPLGCSCRVTCTFFFMRHGSRGIFGCAFTLLIGQPTLDSILFKREARRPLALFTMWLKKVECSDANVWDLQGKVWLRRTSHGTFFDSDGWCGVFSQTFLDFSLASPWEQMSCATSGRKLNLCSPFVSKQLDQLGILLISISSFTWLALTKGPKCQGEDLDLASFEKALELILLREGFLRSN